MMIILGVICVIVLIVIIGKNTFSLCAKIHHYLISCKTSSPSLSLLPLHSVLQHLRRVAPTPVWSNFLTTEKKISN